MKIKLEVTKAELDLLLRGLSDVLSDEVERGTRMNGAYKPTKNYAAAEALETRLATALSEALRIGGEA